MTTLQEYLNNKYSTLKEKECLKEIIINRENSLSEIEGGELDLSEYLNLKRLIIDGRDLKSPLTKLKVDNCSKLVQFKCLFNQLEYLDLSNCSCLTDLACQVNLFSSTDFLKELPYPEKLTYLDLGDNNFAAQDLSFFKRFTNLASLKL